MENNKKKFEWIHQRLSIKVSKKLVSSFVYPEKFTMLNLAIKRFENSFKINFTRKQYIQILEKFVDCDVLNDHFLRKEFDKDSYSILSLSLIKKNKDGGKYIPENLKINPVKVKGYDISLKEFDQALYNQEMVFNLFEIDIDWFLSFDNQEKLSFAIEQIIFETEIFSRTIDFKNYIENMYKNKKFCELYQDKLDLSF